MNIKNNHDGKREKHVIGVEKRNYLEALKEL